MEQNEPSDPIDLSQLGGCCSAAADDAADLIERPGLAPHRAGSSCLYHAVFPYGGRAPLCTIPFAFKTLPASPMLPPRHDTAPTRPASTPTVPQTIPGHVRDKVGAKCLTPPVLNFASGLVAALYLEGLGCPFHVVPGLTTHDSPAHTLRQSAGCGER